MGLLSVAWAYRRGKRKARRRAEAERNAEVDELTEVCDNCGHMRMQHDDEGRCPSY